MIEITKTDIIGFKEALRGMRNPMNSWEKNDSGDCSEIFDTCLDCPQHGETCNDSMPGFHFYIGKNDCELAMDLAEMGGSHAKYRRMITVYADIYAPLYWWKEFDTYKVGTVANSCSTMHKIHEKEFSIEDFSHEHLHSDELYTLLMIVRALNAARKLYLDGRRKDYWWQMIQLLPSSYNQLRTVMLNYEVLANIYHYRRNHKLDEWRNMCKWIETLPWSELITLKEERNG